MPIASTRDTPNEREAERVGWDWPLEQPCRPNEYKKAGRGERPYRSWYAKVAEEILVADQVPVDQRTSHGETDRIRELAFHQPA